MPDVMKTKLINDYFEADEINRAITKKQIDLEAAIPILNDLVKYVENDIKLMSEDAYKKIENKKTILDETNKETKKKIEENTIVDDSEDERNLKLRKLREDHKKLDRYMTLLLEICYRKGWFE